MSERKMAEYLDHAVLKPELTEKEAEDAIRLGVEYGVYSVCVRPCDIELAKKLTAGTKTASCCVLGFPFGYALSESKADEARRYIALGVDEIDMVANYAFARSGLWDRFEADVRAVLGLTRPAGKILKVILEANALTLDEVGKATEACVRRAMAAVPIRASCAPQNTWPGTYDRSLARTVRPDATARFG